MVVKGFLLIPYIWMKLPQSQLNKVKVKVLELSQRQKMFILRKKGNTMRPRGKRQAEQGDMESEAAINKHPPP